MVTIFPGPAFLGRIPRLYFARRNIQPPSVAFMDDDTAIVLTVESLLSGGTVECRGRYLDRDGTLKVFRHQFPTPADSNAQDFVLFLGESFLLGLEVRQGTTPKREGLMFVQLALVQSFSGSRIETQQLGAGYVSQNRALTWPPGRFEPPLSGPGSPGGGLGANPAAGAGFFQSNDVNETRILLGVNFTLVTSAAAAARHVRVACETGGGDIVWEVAAVATQAASTSVNYRASPGGPQQGAISTRAQLSLPVPAVIPPGNVLAVRVTAMQAADQLSAITVFHRQYHERNP